MGRRSSLAGALRFSESASLAPPYPGFHFPATSTVREVFPHTAYRLSFFLERSKSFAA